MAAMAIMAVPKKCDALTNTVYYDWPNTWQIVRDLMPSAAMFSDVGPDFRWVGNEHGFAGEPCWSTINVGDGVPGNTKSQPQPR